MLLYIQNISVKFSSAAEMLLCLDGAPWKETACISVSSLWQVKMLKACGTPGMLGSMTICWISWIAAHQNSGV